MSLESAFNRAWYGNSKWVCLLWPLELVFRAVVALRRRLYQLKILRSYHSSVPVVVVGNICVGGSGKTPFTIALVQQFKQLGLRPGVLSRGYAGTPGTLPLRVTISTPPTISGDEPLLIARHCDCPVFVDPDRGRAARKAEQAGCNILVADDGLQHYALARNVEILVVNAHRGIGNGHLLPVGPLREPPQRADEVDLQVFNRTTTAAVSPLKKNIASADQATSHDIAQGPNLYFALQPTQLIPLNPQDVAQEPGWLNGRTVNAVAGIGNPASFFQCLRTLGAIVNEYPLADHAAADTFPQFDSDTLVVITEKDAVKLADNHYPNGFYLGVEAQLSPSLTARIGTLADTLMRAPA